MLQQVQDEYQKHVVKQTNRILLFIILPALALTLIAYFATNIEVNSILISIGVLTLLLEIRLVVITWRVQHGVFGNTEAEARELIAFKRK